MFVTETAVFVACTVVLKLDDGKEVSWETAAFDAKTAECDGDSAEIDAETDECA
jgi:hypothetical protein